MKISMNNILILTLVLSILTSCTEKKNSQNQDKKNVTKPIILEYKSQIDEYSGQDEYSSQQYLGNKLLYVKKFISPKKTTYVYRYEYYTQIDTLVFFKDSFKMNNENLLLLNKKLIKFKGKEIEIKKYQYNLNRKLSNFFINDSLGIIMEHGALHPSGTAIRKYNPKKHKELCNKIMTDSTFFSLQFDFDYMKKNDNKNSH